MIFGRNMSISSETKECVILFIQFLDLLYVRYDHVIFDHCRICMRDFRERGFLYTPTPIPEWRGKDPSSK